MTVELVGEHRDVAMEAERRIRESILGVRVLPSMVTNPEHIFPEAVLVETEPNEQGK